MSLWMHLIPGYTVTKALTATVGLLSDSSSKPLSELEEIGRRVEIGVWGAMEPKTNVRKISTHFIE